MQLAIRTGIPPSAWAEEGEAAIRTAVAVLNEEADPDRRESAGGPQMSG